MRALLFHNFPLKVLSLVLAIAVFAFLQSRKVVSFKRKASLKILAPADSVVVGSADRLVAVTLRSTNQLLSRPPSERELSGVLDLTDSDQIGRTMRIRLSRENFSVLPERYSLNIHDPWILVDLDRKIKKKVRVNVKINGKLEDHLTLHDVLITPDTVAVSGPSRYIQKLEELQVTPINIERMQQSHSIVSDIVVPEDMSLELETETVFVQVLLSEAVLEKEISQVPVTIPRFLPQNRLKVSVVPKSVNLKVTGTYSQIKDVSLKDVLVSLNLTRVTQRGKFKLKPQIDLRTGLNVKSIEPSVVDVIALPFTRKDASSRQQ